MTKRWTSVLLLCAGILVAGLAGCNKDSEADDANEKQVDVSKIPAAAMETIKKETGDAKIKRVLMGQKKGKPYYEAKYNTKDGKRMMIQVAEDGKLYKTVEDDDPEPK